MRTLVRHLSAAVTAVMLTAFPLAAECTGRNLLDQLPPEDLAALEAAANTVPFPTGNYWRATRGDEVITMIGTYHLGDLRHSDTIRAIQPEIVSAATVLVEAGPEEEKALKDLIVRDPSRMMITEGPTLIDTLPEAIWQDLSAALRDRGVPGFMAAKLRPWYAMSLLSVPPCAIPGMTGSRGLDGLVIDAAIAAGVPVQGLEPFDTVFTIFDLMTEAETVAMIQSSLAVEDRAQDYFITLADSYFAGKSRLIWEYMRVVSHDMPGYTPQEVDRDFARMENLLMATRNRAWIPVLTGAAAKGPVFAAFGALHLSGDQGVLNLLQNAGYTLTELPL